MTTAAYQDAFRGRVAFPGGALSHASITRYGHEGHQNGSFSLNVMGALPQISGLP
jgi:hypothetical protein